WRVGRGATLAGGTVTLNGASRLYATAAGGVLDNVILNGVLDLTTAAGVFLTVRNGLTLNGTAVIGTSGYNTTLRFEGTQTLGGGAVVLLDGADARNGLVVMNSADMLTLGASVTVMGGNGTIGFTSLSRAPNVGFINRGTISADAPGRTLNLAGQNWTNLGTIQALFGGTLNLNGTGWSNGGTLGSDGGTVNVNGTWASTRLMAFANAAVRFMGTGSVSGAINTASTTVSFDAVMNGSLRTLVLRATDSVWRMN